MKLIQIESLNRIAMGKVHLTFLRNRNFLMHVHTQLLSINYSIQIHIYGICVFHLTCIAKWPFQSSFFDLMSTVSESVHQMIARKAKTANK